ncbi:hypothetical protein M218_08225 [Burkholderia pseudomallei MSHR338]|nr:hypothetical protein M218_08225 [Burkholderia pseudomallei MSHR338]
MHSIASWRFVAWIERNSGAIRRCCAICATATRRRHRRRDDPARAKRCG